MTPRRTYSRHGLNALKARVMVKGLAAIDKRTVAAQSLIAWRSELLTDLGGEEIVSAQQLALVEMVTRTRLYIEHLVAFLCEQESLINRKRKAVFPVLRERQQLVDSLARILGQLGLERRARPVKTLEAHVAERYGTGLPGDSRQSSRQVAVEADGAVIPLSSPPAASLDENEGTRWGTWRQRPCKAF